MPVMGAKRQSYTPRFRQEAAHLVIDTGRTVAEVAREIGVGEQLLGRLVAIERSRMDDPPAAVAPMSGPSCSGCAVRWPSCGWIGNS